MKSPPLHFFLSTFQPFDPSTFRLFNISTFQLFNLSTLLYISIGGGKPRHYKNFVQPFNFSTLQLFDFSTFQSFNLIIYFGWRRQAPPLQKFRSTVQLFDSSTFRHPVPYLWDCCLPAPHLPLD